MPASAALGLPAGPAARTVMWDLDGTLCDSFLLSFGATQDVLAKHGYSPATEDDYHACSRCTTQERLATHAGLKRGDEAFERVGKMLAADFEPMYISQVSPATAPLFEKTANIVRRLGAAGIPQACLTNAAASYADAVLKTHDLRRFFTAVHGADTVPRHKPSPDGVLKCIEDLVSAGLLAPAPEGACAGVYIGDSPSDGEAARRAGICSIGVAWGSHKLESLKNSGKFDVICVEEQELVDLLLPQPTASAAEQAVKLDGGRVTRQKVAASSAKADRAAVESALHKLTSIVEARTKQN